jgi:hypothetical protein
MAPHSIQGYRSPMPRSLFAAFRSADGRSFAQALALLVMLSSIFGGVTAGAAAAADDIRHCIDTPFGALPNAHDGLACCPGMMMGGAPLLPPPALPSFEFQGRQAPVLPAPRDAWIPDNPVAPSDRPRGPPLSA